MKIIIKSVIIALLVFSLCGCNNDVSESKFNNFAVKCEATEYYKSCNELIKNAQKQYFYDFEIEMLIFYTYTMVEKCEFDSMDIPQLKEDLNSEFNPELISDSYSINGFDYEIYLVKYDDWDSPFGAFHKFGFIAVDEENSRADFYWFYNQDYDPYITDEASFDDVFNMYFDWCLN